MKKMCVMLAMAICFGFAGCKKSSPESPKPAEKAAETANPAADQATQALNAAVAAVDLTSPIEKLAEQAKSMNIDTLKATAEKYKAQYLSMRNDLTTKMEQLAKLTQAGKTGAEVLGLSKDIEILTNTLASLKDRMMVYVDALKAQGVDISSFTLE